MQVTVKFFGIFKTLAGQKELRLDLDEGTTLRQALGVIGKRLAPEFSDQVLAPLEKGPVASLQALILLNQTHLADAAEFDRPLRDGDRVAWVPPMEGGTKLFKTLTNGGSHGFT
jgi:molybdopterin converting factor small subunit